MSTDRTTIPVPLMNRNQNKPKHEQTANAKKYPQGFFKPKPCRKCSSEFSPYAPSEHYCSDTCKNYARADKALYNAYGIGVEDYRDLFVLQSGACKICKQVNTVKYGKESVSLCVDHDHTSGIVRGLLCQTCNSALGQFKDSETLLTSAIAYLKEPTKVFEPSPYRPRSRSSKISISKDVIFNVIIDRFTNNFTRTQLMSKYELKEGRVKGIDFEIK